VTNAFDSVVVGSGIVGAACAASLAKAGMSVALVDEMGTGLGATAAGMGHVVVMDDSEEQLQLTQYSQALWHTLAHSLPTTAEHQRCGTLWVAADGDEMDEVARKHNVYQDHGTETEILDMRALHALEPELNEKLAGALLVRSDSVVYAPAVAAFLVEQAVARGAAFVDGRVTQMGSGTVLLSDGRELKSRCIVNAAGERSAELTRGLPLKKRMGHLAITDRYPGFVHHQIVELGYLKSAHSIAEDSVAFNLQPRVTGQILIGSSRQYDAPPAVDFEILSRMLERATAYMPRLADLSVLRVWTGYRAATSDKLPLVGPWPEDETIFLATGHEGLGITTSLATAELLLACIQGSRPAIPLEPYLPARFSSMPAYV
jgi:glycine/D-amino acid oxidase-like deaminating enzyme